MNPIFSEMIAAVDGEFKRRVLSLFFEHIGERMSKPALAVALFGPDCAPTLMTLADLERPEDPDSPAYPTAERMIRLAVADLIKAGFPILSNSGHAGYILSADPAELELALADLSARIAALEERRAALARSVDLAKQIKAASTGAQEIAIQRRLL